MQSWDNQDLMRLFMPILRSDFRLCEEYEAPKPYLLQVPVTALSGNKMRGHRRLSCYGRARQRVHLNLAGI
jgi:surfactin synthase thioesterase subunit